MVLPTVAFNPARLLAGAGEAAHDAGYQMDVISLAGGSAQWAMRMPELIASHQFEGVLSFAAVPDGVVDPETTVLVTGDFDEGMRGVGALADGSTVADVMTELVERGHRRFLHIAGDRRTTSRRPGEAALARAERTTSGSSRVSPPPTNASTAATAVMAFCIWCGPKRGRNRSS